MNRSAGRLSILISTGLALLLTALMNPATADVERFPPRQGGSVEVWRVTHDPGVRDWASYHSTRCFSPDGRYLAYVHYAGDPDELDLPPKDQIEHDDLYHPQGTRRAREIHLVDLHDGTDRDLRVPGNGADPRWAHIHNWLFWTQSEPRDASSPDQPTRVMWLDVDTGRLEQIATGVRSLKFTDCDDRWLFGFKRFEDGRAKAVRIPIRKDSQAEELQGDWAYGGNTLYTNPVRPVIVSRDNSIKQYPYAAKVWKPEGYLGTYDVPFPARHFFTCELDGANRTVPFPSMEGGHFSWLGDGSYFLCGNGTFRGWKCDEPLPANIHLLGAIRCASDPSPCGRSGRWISGSSAGPMQIVDRRSGDGWNYLDALSRIHDSDRFSYCYGSGLSDNDAKGSPDGTKICFVTNYDLKDGPITRVTERVSGRTGDRIPVQSTEGFPESGRLSLRNEIIAYQRKTAASFEGLTRRLYNTHPVILEHLTPERRKQYEARPVDLNSGDVLTSFDTRCIPEDRWKRLPLPAKVLANYDGPITPLLRQAMTDVYVAVVRLPDRPHLRAAGGRFELIPGENHWETAGYRIFKDGRRLAGGPFRPGSSVRLPGPGVYTARAIEWSGLESQPSLPLEVPQAANLDILRHAPEDFSFTSDRFLVDGREVTGEAARRAPEAIREIVHLDDGVIHREWHAAGEIRKRHDLNLQGKPIRRLEYRSGKLARREYHNRDGDHTSTEIFSPDGRITESIEYRGSGEASHWWYDQTVPVKYTGRNGAYVKAGDGWKKVDAE